MEKFRNDTKWAYVEKAYSFNKKGKRIANGYYVASGTNRINYPTKIFKTKAVAIAYAKRMVK